MILGSPADKEKHVKGVSEFQSVGPMIAKVTVLAIEVLVRGIRGHAQGAQASRVLHETHAIKGNIIVDSHLTSIPLFNISHILIWVS